MELHLGYVCRSMRRIVFDKGWVIEQEETAAFATVTPLFNVDDVNRWHGFSEAWFVFDPLNPAISFKWAVDDDYRDDEANKLFERIKGEVIHNVASEFAALAYAPVFMNSLKNYMIVSSEEAIETWFDKGIRCRS